MAEEKTNMTDEQLAQELRKSKGGKLGGKILSLLGGVIAVAGIILGGNIVLIVIGRRGPRRWGRWCRASPRSNAGRADLRLPSHRTSWALPLKTCR